jgi:hypothetical protein
VHGSPTLDYDAVPASLADAAVTPGDPAYGRLTSTYFRGGAPGIVLLPRTVEQVVDAVDFARRLVRIGLGARWRDVALSTVAGGLLGLLRVHQHHPEQVDQTSVDQLAEALLRMLGIPVREAKRIAGRALPDIGAW